MPSVLHFAAVSVPASNTLAYDHFCELESREIVVMGYESVSLRSSDKTSGQLLFYFFYPHRRSEDIFFQWFLDWRGEKHISM